MNWFTKGSLHIYTLRVLKFLHIKGLIRNHLVTLGLQGC